MNKPKLNRKQLGSIGETAAEHYLSEHGFVLLERNWRCRTGEIDLIAVEQDHLVIIEVRTRSPRGSAGTPLESVTPKKQKQVMETAQVYLYRQRRSDWQVRFDVVSVQTDLEGKVTHIEHIRSAF